MKIYTRTGDEGDTGLFGGPRVRKDAPRIEAYGTVDELNAALGLARAANQPPEVDTVLLRVQHELFVLGAELACPQPTAAAVPRVDAAQVAALEAEIDRFEAGLPPLKQFILPAGASTAAHLHLARTICRRAERRVVALAAIEPLSPVLVQYLNRLSDLLFVLARAANHAAGQPDVPWQRKTSS
jgi:cob(I)alamin adenosyltransferase